MLTAEEKLKWIAGRSFWTFGVGGSGEAPVLRVSDGPAGLRLQYRDEGAESRSGSKPAVCYPSAAACAASFDRDLMKKVGKALGLDCREQEVAVLLGPALNIKRSPLCGRNFEYFSEDPVLSGEMAAACVKGIQGTGTGACIKHFAGNSQETKRFTGDSVIDPETLFGIYLKAFEIVIDQADPAMVMLAYNKLNGVYCCENKWLITDVLRNEFGFRGACVSDWGAVNRLCASFNAGLDLRMPGGVDGDEDYLKTSFAAGRLRPEALDRAAEKLSGLVERRRKALKKSCKYDREKNIKAARKMAEASIVLLKNEGMMPLPKNKKVLVVGEMAKFPKYRGGGSGTVKPAYAVTPWMELKKAYENISYSGGYEIFGNGTASEALIHETCRAASEADSVIVFAGLPETYETEGLDRKDLSLPKPQDELIEKLSEINPEISVVVQAGSAVLMPWADRVKSIFMCYPLGGCAGEAVSGVITGSICPSGKLPETFVKQEKDLVTYNIYPARGEKAVYAEGKYVGYRYFDARNIPVLFPFGHGLSYTEFVYEDFQARIKDGKLELSVDVSNTGSRKGAETVQFYIAHENEENCKELIAFEKEKIGPGKKVRITAKAPLKFLSVLDVRTNERVVRSGKYRVYAAASSRDIRCVSEVFLEKEMRKQLSAPVPFAEDPAEEPYGQTFSGRKRSGRNTTLADLEQDRPFRHAAKAVKALLSGKKSGFAKGTDLYSLMADTPIRMLPMGTNGKITAKQITKAGKVMDAVRARFDTLTIPRK